MHAYSNIRKTSAKRVVTKVRWHMQTNIKYLHQIFIVPSARLKVERPIYICIKMAFKNRSSGTLNEKKNKKKTNIPSIIQLAFKPSDQDKTCTSKSMLVRSCHRFRYM